MKFLCDRCKTRYSIGDDRVRGKILKIRCKNCANVITVREGMTDADAGAPEAGARRAKPTTMSPPIASAAPASAPTGNGAPAAGALGAAFSAAMIKPPPALEEEWYVSIDGDQQGPFSLADAQRWISSKAYDAELHCWSEGFDDWLPVDKVSHFRGLRKKPAPPPAPPPLPRATGAQPTLRAQAAPVEDEPKPLFAATMAQLEKSAAAAAAQPLGMPAGRPSATPPGGSSRYPSPLTGVPSVQTKTNGSSTGPARAIPSVGTNGSAKPRAESKPGFDGATDQATQIDMAPFEGEAATSAEPVAAAKRAIGDLKAAAARAPSPLPTPRPMPVAKATPTPSPAPKPAATPFADHAAPVFPEPETPPPGDPFAAIRSAAAPIGDPADDDEDDGLSIGEVSRVVNLADLAKTARRSSPGQAAATADTATPAPIARRTTSNPALGLAARSGTGAVARISATGAVAKVDDPNAPAGAALGLGTDGALPPGTEMAMQPAPAETSHKRGMIILIGVATLLLAGVIITVVMLQGGGDTIDKGLGRTDTIDTSRPDDPTRPRLPGDPPGPGSATTNPVGPKQPVRPRNPVNTSGSGGTQTAAGSNHPDVLDGPGLGTSLSPDDIDTVSKKYATGTQRCYMRSQKGVDAITVGAVKSIQATLTVGKDGLVTDVALASHADDNLGKCLTSALKGWRFRANPGGRVKFTLAFAQE